MKMPIQRPSSLEGMKEHWSAGVSPASSLEISVASLRGKATKRAGRPCSNVNSRRQVEHSSLLGLRDVAIRAAFRHVTQSGQ
jgi:hypothetical protein